MHVLCVITNQSHGFTVLLAAKAQLAWTDGVIDQIVYRLYGLTEKEIAVVEGKR